MDNSLRMNLDRVESWRKSVENGINDFLLTLPQQVRENLDYSPNSLKVLEAWLLETYQPLELVPDPSQVFIPDGVMYYIGETFRKYLGGYWNIHFAKVEPDYRYGEDPVVEGFFRDKDVAVSAWVLIGKALEKRTGNYLNEVLEFYMRLYKPNSR